MVLGIHKYFNRMCILIDALLHHNNNKHNNGPTIQPATEPDENALFTRKIEEANKLIESDSKSWQLDTRVNGSTLYTTKSSPTCQFGVELMMVILTWEKIVLDWENVVEKEE